MCLGSESSIREDAKQSLNQPWSPPGRAVALQAFPNQLQKSLLAFWLQRTGRGSPGHSESNTCLSFHPTDTGCA